VPIWFFGALSIGAALVKHQFLIPGRSDRAMLSDSGARILLTLDGPIRLPRRRHSSKRDCWNRIVAASLGAGELAPLVAHFASDLGKSVLPLTGAAEQRWPLRQAFLESDRDPCVLQYTGGTTGAPKGAIADAREPYDQCAPTRMWFPFLQTDRNAVDPACRSRTLPASRSV